MEVEHERSQCGGPIPRNRVRQPPLRRARAEGLSILGLARHITTGTVSTVSRTLRPSQR